MQRITQYTLNDDGSYSAVVEGVFLDNDQTLMLDNGMDVAVDVRIHDPFKITDKQRRKIFALVNDIEAHTGMPRDYMREMFADYVKVLEGYEERLSLASCSKQQASEIIEVIIMWVFQHEIPLNYKTSDLMKEDKAFIYAATLNRNCIICGKQNSDLAHREAVGSGRNRRTMSHHNHHVLALCRSHHNQQHQMGVDSFDRHYHIENSWIKVTPELNKKLQGK